MDSNFLNYPAHSVLKIEANASVALKKAPNIYICGIWLFI